MRMILLTALLLITPITAARAQSPVALELVLLADATGSIDDAEIRFQREGYANAITHPDVLDAIRFTGPVAMIYVEWADAGSQHIVADWMVVEDASSAQSFATALLEPPRQAFGRNAIGAALLFGKQLIEENELPATGASSTCPPTARITGTGRVLSHPAMRLSMPGSRSTGWPCFAETVRGGPSVTILKRRSSAASSVGRVPLS